MINVKCRQITINKKGTCPYLRNSSSLLLQMPVNPVAQHGRRFKRQSLPDSFRQMVHISIGLFADRLAGCRVVVANQLRWFRAPFTLELRKSRMSVGHFAKIKPAKAGLTCFLDCER